MVFDYNFNKSCPKCAREREKIFVKCLHKLDAMQYSQYSLSNRDLTVYNLDTTQKIKTN